MLRAERYKHLAVLERELAEKDPQFAELHTQYAERLELRAVEGKLIEHLKEQVKEDELIALKEDELIASLRELAKEDKQSFVTVVEGLPDDLDLKKILKAFKKNFKCDGLLKKDSIIQLSGDQHWRVISFLTELGICGASQCVRHDV